MEKPQLTDSFNENTSDTGIVLYKIDVAHNEFSNDNSDSTRNEGTPAKNAETQLSLTPISAPTLLSDLDWDNPADPSNPKNWPVWKKCYITFTVGYMCLIITFGSSVYVPSVNQLMQRFGISETLGLSGLTFYLLGLGVGPIFAAPLSELYGRKPIYLLTTPISMIFILGTAFCKHFYQILILRFFTGVFVSPAMAVAGGSISDIFDRNMVGLAMSVFALTPFCGTILGPIIGSFAMETKTWQWVMWLQLMFCGTCVPLVIFLPETFKPAILAKRAHQRGINLVREHHKSSWQKEIKEMLTVSALQPLQMFYKEPIVLFLSIYSAFVFSILFGFFESYPIIFRGVYGMSLGISSLMFVGVGIGLIFADLIYFYFDRKIAFPLNADGTRGHKTPDGVLLPPDPERMLMTCKIGAVLFPVSMFWQAWTARESIHWIVPCLSGVFFGIAIFQIFFCIIVYFSFTYPPIILASALAANNLLRYLMASVFPLFIVQTYNRLGVHWASSLFGFIALAMMPLPWVFTYLGPRLRAASKFNIKYQQLLKHQQQYQSEHKDTHSV